MPKKMIAYHKQTGPHELDSIEFRRVVSELPKEWKAAPWSKEQATAEPARPEGTDEHDVDISENLPVNRTVETVVGEDGVKTVVIGAGNDAGPPPRRPGIPGGVRRDRV
jgi:hypothetical protein